MTLFFTFLLHLVAFATFSLILPVFLAWHCALSFLSFVATGKPLTRSRLALAHEAVRGTYIPTTFLFFSYVDSFVLQRGTLAREALNLRETCFACTSIFVDPNISRSCFRDALVNART